MGVKRFVVFAGICLAGSLAFVFLRSSPRPQTFASPETIQAATELIDIDTLSEDYMTSYFSDVLSMSDSHQPGLIVTSESYPADTYGATKVISAPNHQYFLYFESDQAKEVAARALADTSVAVEEDIALEITDTTYNSWGITDMGLDSAAEYFTDQTAPEITVAIVDTGLDVSLFEANFTDRLAGSYNLYDQYMHDGEGHGTHIAGTIAEGTPSNVKILPVKAADSRNMNLSVIITAINYVNYYHAADVINMSFGVSYNNGYALLSLYAAIQAATNNNIICVAAAGNDGGDADTFFPAAYPNTISVAAVDSAHNRASFSNYGSTVTFAAPGVGIKSINKTLNGTSMATPHIAAAAAVLKSTNPTLSTPAVTAILKEHAIDLGDEGYDQYYGYGYIDLSDYATFANRVVDSDSSDFRVTEVIVNPIFGNITNLMNTAVEITHENGTIDSLTLSDLEGLEITGYDAFSAGEQQVVLSWQGHTTEITVDNGTDGGNYSAYTFWQVSDTEYGISAIAGGQTLPHKIYLPATINDIPVVSLGNYAHQSGVFTGGNTNVTHLVLPDTLREIGTYAFASDPAIVSVQGGAAEGLTVGNRAFYLARNLTEFTPVIKSLGAVAFAGASNLKSATLSNELITLPNNAFESCYNLTELNLPQNLTTIGAYALYKTRISSISLPKTLASIGVQAFYGMPALEYIYIDPENPIYTSDGPNANAIIEISSNTLLVGSGHTIIPDYVTKIADNAFIGNQTLTTLATNQVTSLGVNLFNECTNFTSLEINNIDLLTTGNLSGRFKGAATAAIPNLAVYISTMPEDTSFLDTLSSEGIKAVIVTTPAAINISADTEYLAYEQVKNLTIDIEYSGRIVPPYTLAETITDYEIIYEHGDAFTAGDTSFTVRATTQYGYTFIKSVAVTVEDCFDKNLNIKNQQFILSFGSTFSDLLEHISFDASIISHHDSAGDAIDTDQLKTGDKLRIAVDPNRTIEYDLAVRGDVDGNGQIGIIDYIRIKKDIMALETLAGVYREAADMNDNQTIDIIDYIRIKKIIMENN